MIKIFIILCIISFTWNIKNSIYLKNNNKKSEMYYYALFPVIISSINYLLYALLILMFARNNTSLMPLNLIYGIALNFTFLLVNSFIVVSIGINHKKDKFVTIGLIMIFTLPILLIVSLPIEIALFIFVKIRKKSEKNIKVSEEELFDDLITASDIQKLYK